MSFSKTDRFFSIKSTPTPGPGQYKVNFDHEKRGAIYQKICASPRFPQECSCHSGAKKCSMFQCSKQGYISKRPSFSYSRSPTLEDLSTLGSFLDENSNNVISSKQNENAYQNTECSMRSQTFKVMLNADR